MLCWTAESLPASSRDVSVNESNLRCWSQSRLQSSVCGSLNNKITLFQVGHRSWIPFSIIKSLMCLESLLTFVREIRLWSSPDMNRVLSVLNILSASRSRVARRLILSGNRWNLFFLHHLFYPRFTFLDIMSFNIFLLQPFSLSHHYDIIRLLSHIVV